MTSSVGWRPLAACTLLLAAWSVAARAEAPRVTPVAVLAFSERGREVQEMGDKVTDLLFANLVVNPELYLVDRADLQKLLEEQALGLAGLADPQKAARVGQLTGAKIMVTGSVLQVDNQLYLVAKVIGTETSRVLGASARGSVRDDLGDLVEGLAEKVAATILERADDLVPKPVTRADRVAEVKEKLGESPLPAVRVHIPEFHVGQITIDPAAETEITMFCTETGFTVIDPKEGRRQDADVLIEGEAMSEFAARRGNLVVVNARLEVKAIDQKTGQILVADRHTSIGVGLSEQIAGKSALQEAGAVVAARLLPKLAERAK